MNLEDGWAFVENFSEKTAFLKNGAEALMIHALFAETTAWDISEKLIEARKAKVLERAREAARVVEEGAGDDEPEVPAPAFRSPAKVGLKRAGSANFSPAPSSKKKPRRAGRWALHGSLRFFSDGPCVAVA